MKLFLPLISVALFRIIPALSNYSPHITQTTAERIALYNYPVETHNVQTKDGYILTMFRIPYSPKLNNERIQRPVAFLMHGLLSSSDCWILNGPDEALAFLLADAGYDVWMGNARGNTYSKRHISKSTRYSSFWDFSWHEIGIYDLPAMFDYILQLTDEKGLHYVGHSQGTTVFFVLMSTIPSYNTKIKTSHMLAPVAFMDHMRSLLITLVSGPFSGSTTYLTQLIGSSEYLPSSRFLSMIGSKGCADTSIFQSLCSNTLFLIAGYDSKHLNYTLLPLVAETHPAGSSTNQFIHYLQSYKSGKFRQFDHGFLGNERKYDHFSPPEYQLNKVSAPVRTYYADNDKLSAVDDVLKLEERLSNVVESFHIPIPEWNHLDYLWALEVKQVIYDKIIAAANQFEQTGKQ